MSEMSEHNVTAKNGAFKIHRAECKITFLPVSRCFDGCQLIYIKASGDVLYDLK